MPCHDRERSLGGGFSGWGLFPSSVQGFSLMRLSTSVLTISLMVSRSWMRSSAVVRLLSCRGGVSFFFCSIPLLYKGSTVVGMVIIFCKYRGRTREEALQNQSKFLQNRAIFTSAILAKSCIKRLEFLYIKESGRGKCKNVILWCFLCKDLVGIERFYIFGEKFTLSLIYAQ